MVDRLLLWQLMDSALPTGAFAHSGGLEAWSQIEGVDGSRGLRRILADLLAQQAYQFLPLVCHVWREPDAWPRVDRQAQALLVNHVANQASRKQGLALLRVAVGMFYDQPIWTALQQQRRSAGLVGHLAPIFGLVGHHADLGSQDLQEGFLFISLRDLLSAAIRLGLTGPLEAQHIQRDLAAAIPVLVDRAPDTCEQVFPIQDIIHANHDRLYSHLFAS